MSRPFREFMAKVRQGAMDDELTTALSKLVSAIKATDKGGSLTLKIKIRPTKGLALEIEDQITLDLPELAKPATMLFPTVEGNLQEQNPLQKSLDLTVVNDKPAPLQTVEGGAAPDLQTAGGAS